MKRLYVKGKQFWAIDQDYRQPNVTITEGALGHLQRLDLSDNYLTPAGVKLVKKLAKEVLVVDQREPYDWDEDQRRYASVGE